MLRRIRGFAINTFMPPNSGSNRMLPPVGRARATGLAHYGRVQKLGCCVGKRMRGTFDKAPGGLEIIEMARAPSSIVKLLSHVASQIGMVALEGLSGNDGFILSGV